MRNVVTSPNNSIDLADLDHELRKGRLIPISINAYTAVCSQQDNGYDSDSEFYQLKRQNELLKIITPEIEANETRRYAKVDKLAKTSIPINEIADAYSIVRAAIKKASRTRSYIANTNNVNNDDRDEYGLTPLEKQLKILNYEI